MASRPRRRRVEPTDEWEQIELLCGWPEQRDYELIRPLVLFGAPADGRSQETGVSSGRTLRRRAARFEAEGMDNHSRCILASAVTKTQDLASYLSVLYAAVERYDSPEALVADGGGVFRARQARAVYEALGIAKHEIERGRPWHNYVETTFNVQRRMADCHFARAESWPVLVEAHGRFVEDYNAQAHFAHQGRAFFSARFVRVLDSLGYTCFRRWRIYGEEALAGREAALWLATESLTVEHAGESLSRYEVRIEPESGELRSVARSRLFENYHGLRRPQRRLFALDFLGEGGWLKALKLRGYVARG
jgi:hypothetical protein